MRLVILKDKLITREQLNELTENFSEFINEHVGITPEYFIEEYDFGGVPTETDSDGDVKPSAPYRKALADEVFAKYGSWGTDSLVMLVHRDNWRFKGIWGQNWSNKYHTYHFHLCRFDNQNVANSLGTLYHEWMHCLDALVKTHVNVNLDTVVGVPWDKFVVHGGRPDQEGTTEWKYIKWKDNTKALKLAAPYVKQAYKRRKELYLEPYKKVQLRVIDWLRSLLNRK